MASVSSKTEEVVHKILEEKKAFDDVILDGEENTATYSAIVSDEKLASKDVSIIEGLEKSLKIREFETPEKIVVDSSSPTRIEVNVKDLHDEIGIPEEQKKESSNAVVPDASETKENDDLTAPASIEVFVNQIEVAQNSTDLTAAEVSSDHGRAPEATEIVEEKDNRSNIKKKGIEETVKDLNIVPEAIEVPSKGKEVSAGDERKSEGLKDGDATSVKSPKDFSIFEESLEQVIEKNKNESTNDFGTPKSAAEAVKQTGSSEMVKDEKNDSKDDSLAEKIIHIPDDTKKQKHLEEAIQITTDVSEKKELGAEPKKSQKSNEVDPIVSSDTADTKLTKESTKRESNNLFSKAKRSIVKAKKVILGK